MVGKLKNLRVTGFRSILDLDIPLGDVNIITGPNGCGKSNLFSAISLLCSALQGNLGEFIAQNGGMGAITWAGPRQTGPLRTTFAIITEDFSYSLEIGVIPMTKPKPLFPNDPEIKSETVKLAGKTMVERGRTTATFRNLRGEKNFITDLTPSESIFSQIPSAAAYPYLYDIRELVTRWCFYPGFRSDSTAPARQPAFATLHTTLKSDGSNLAPLLHAILASDREREFRTAWEAAFPQTHIRTQGSTFDIKMEGLLRAMSADEISDGTMKFLCLAAACLPVQHVPLVAFNEPEASLNPAIFGSLAELFEIASRGSQLILTTHAEGLVTELTNRIGCTPIRLSKVNGETVLDGLSTRKGYRLPEE